MILVQIFNPWWQCFQYEEKDFEKLNLKCPSAVVMSPSFISEAVLQSQQGPLWFHGRRQKMWLLPKRAGPCSAQPGNSKVEDISSDFVFL